MILWFAAVAAASPVRDGLQARIFPAGYDFVASSLEGTVWPFGPTQFVGTWECYDPITVDDLNLSVELNTVSLIPRERGIGLGATLGEVRGEDMRLSGESGWIDLCIDFNSRLEYIELENGVITGELDAKVEGDAVELWFPEPVVLSGEFSSNIAWFPDQLAWGFMENTALEAGASLIQEELPALVSSLTADSLVLSTFGDLDVSITPREASANAQGLYAAVDVDLGGDGGTGASLTLNARNQAHFAVGLTAALAEEVLQAAWIRGLLSSQSTAVGPLLQELLVDLGLDEGVEVFIGLAGPPAVVIDETGIYANLEGLKLELTDESGEPLLILVVDGRGWLEAKLVDGAILLTVHELEVETTRLDAERLLADGRNSENLNAFLEGWVIEIATALLKDLVLWESHFEALGYVLRLDDSGYQSGGLVVWATLFAADDPAVDKIAPETTAEAAVLEDTKVLASWGASDDRVGQLLYRYRVDDRAWSRWTSHRRVTLEVEEPGSHQLSVVARDGWFNEDQTPAVATFTIAEPPAPAAAPSRACGCALVGASAGGPPAGALGAAALMLLLGLRRRQ